jgi:peroxiredoxin
VGARRKAARFAIITPNSQRWALTFYSLSTQSTEYQKEMAERLHLPFPALSDANFALCAALRLPMFEADGKRLTLIIADGRIEAVFYPIFPPDRNAGDVIDWLRNNRVRCA